MAYPQSSSSPTVSISSWNLEVVVLMEGGKYDNTQDQVGKDENQKQTQPTFDTKSGI